MSSTATEIPGYLAGTWAVDTAHTDVSFVVRHMMVSKVRGRFTRFEGQLVTAEDPLESTVTATIELDSLDTNEPNRDAHIRSADFFDVEKYPTMSYRSTRIRRDGNGFVMHGELDLHGVTREVPLELEFNGVATDPQGGTRSGFSATGQISRKDFGIDIDMPPGVSAVALGDVVKVVLDLQLLEPS
jgi:polyisoprenoid-binding protein YceI